MKLYLYKSYFARRGLAKLEDPEARRKINSICFGTLIEAVQVQCASFIMNDELSVHDSESKNTTIPDS